MKKQTNEHKEKLTNRAMEWRDGAGPQEAQRIHTTHMGPQGQGAQQVSRARQGEAHSATVTVAPPRGVSGGGPVLPPQHPLQLLGPKGPQTGLSLACKEGLVHLSPTSPGSGLFSSL